MIEKINMKDKILLDYEAGSELCKFNILVCSSGRKILWFFRGFVVLYFIKHTDYTEFLIFNLCHLG